MYFQSVILLWTTFVTFSHCHSIANQFYGGEGGYGGLGSSEELYSGIGGGGGRHLPPPEPYFHPEPEFNPGPPREIYSRPNQGFYPGLPQGIHSSPSQGFYPEPHQRNLMHHLPPPGPSMYEDMPLAHNQLNIVPAERFQNQGLFSHSRPHYFNPEVMGGLFENPLTAMMDPMRKQMSESIKGMGDNMGKQVDEMGKQVENASNQMGEAGKKAMDTMQKPAEEIGKEMEEAMENAQDEFGKRVQTAREGAEGISTGKMPFALPSNTTEISDGKKKLEGLDSKKDEGGVAMSDAKKNAQDAAGDAAKKMQETGNKLRKSFPIPASHFLGRIKDETTEVHDYDGEFPRAEAMEWGSPDFVDVRHHPRSQFYDYYYDGGY